MINGRPYQQFKLRRRAIGSQEAFSLGSFVAFFSAKVLRGGPRAIVQLTTCLVLLALLLKLLPYRANYGGWIWQKVDTQKSLQEDDNSVPGGLRIVVFGENDVATPTRLQDRGVDGAAGRSWTELLCEELDCSSHISLVPTSDDPSHVVTSTKLYATSVEQALNLTFENYGPGLDYNFMLDQFPIVWKVNDLSKQVDEFLSMKKPKHSPAETLWVLSFGTWDIWSLATEPLSVSKAIVESIVDQIFLEVERLYASAMDDTSIAWSEPELAQSMLGGVSDGLPAPTPNTESGKPWIIERDPSEEDSLPGEEDNSAEPEPGPDPTKHFQILIPKLFDPSLTPGWHDARPKTPAVHSKAEQMRNAAALTERWNAKMWTAMAQWIRSDERRQEGVEVPRAGKTAAEIVNEKIAAARERQAQRQREKTGVIGGRNHALPPTPIKRREADVAPMSAKQADAARDMEEKDDVGLSQPQRDGILYDMNNYLQEVIAQRQLQISGLRDARQIGKLTVDGFNEVWTPCVGEVTGTSGVRANNAEAAPEEENGASREGDAPYERKRSEEPAIRGRAPTSPSSTPEPGEAAVSICEDPDEHLFYTGFTVSQRAVAAIARQAADMVRRNETLRAGWAGIRLPPLKWVGG